jgi:hypothetical protein
VLKLLSEAFSDKFSKAGDFSGSAGLICSCGSRKGRLNCWAARSIGKEVPLSPGGGSVSADQRILEAWEAGNRAEPLRPPCLAAAELMSVLVLVRSGQLRI